MGRASISINSPRPPLNSNDGGIERRVNAPNEEGNIRLNADTPQMTSGGPKSDTLSAKARAGQ